MLKKAKPNEKEFLWNILQSQQEQLSESLCKMLKLILLTSKKPNNHPLTHLIVLNSLTPNGKISSLEDLSILMSSSM
jgi:hypothetical protein